MLSSDLLQQISVSGNIQKWPLNLKGLLVAHRGGYMESSQREKGHFPLLWRASDFLKWEEIYYQAHAISVDGYRPAFMIINGTIYLIQICIWIYSWWSPSPIVEILSKLFFAGVSFFAALVFLLYGGRLFLKLQHFPVESTGHRKKLQEVQTLMFWIIQSWTLCTTC